MQIVGSNLISIFIVFALLYWVGMARMVRSQILTLKEMIMSWQPRLWEPRMAVSLKASADQLYRYSDRYHHTADPFLYFTESYLSFLGMGVAVPLPSLGSLASDAINGMITFPYLLFAPCLLIS